MSIIIPIVSGAVRAIKSIKGILVIWVSTLLLVSLVALPLRSSVKSVLGSSMITEKLRDGINMDVLADFGTNLLTIFSSMRSGILLSVLFGFLLNIFFNGGIFTTLRNDEEKYSSSQFFRGAGRHFWSFLVITFIMTLIILILFIMVFLATSVIWGSASEGEEGSGFKGAVVGAVISILLLPVFLLVTDYARIWQVTCITPAGFKAIGIGFKQTFGHFFSSYPVMFINVIIQALFAWFVLKFTNTMGPQTGVWIFILFLLSQCLFILKILLRVWRYGSVYAMYLKHPDKNTISGT